MRLDEFAREMARPLGLKGQQRRTELVPSITMGHELRVESSVEALAAVALDIDPRVTSIEPQPFSIRLDLLEIFPTKKAAQEARPKVPARADRKDPEQDCIYTPDFRVGCGGTSFVIECKLAHEEERIAAKLEQWRSGLSAFGYSLLCVTDDDVQTPGLHFNMVCIRDSLQALDRGGHGPLAPVLAHIDGCNGPLTVGALQAVFPDYLIQMGIASGALGCDLKSGVLGPTTALWPANGDLSHLCVLDLEF
jgi:hypothetical protein